MREKYFELQKKLNYQFKNIELLDEAFHHRSWLNECSNPNTNSNERLEFLGDAVLELIVSDWLYRHFFDFPEGKLTKMRAQAVCETSFAKIAKELDLSKYLYMSRGEMKVHGNQRPSILADCFEAMCGAIYLDSGTNWHKNFFNCYLTEMFQNEKTQKNLNDEIFIDYKSLLQEKMQQYKRRFEYRVIDEKGPDHEKVFTIALYIDGKKVSVGQASNKKKAQQLCAKQYYESIKK